MTGLVARLLVVAMLVLLGTAGGSTVRGQTGASPPCYYHFAERNYTVPPGGEWNSTFYACSGLDMRNVTWVLFFAPDEPAFYHADWRPSFLTYPLPGPSTLAANTSTLVNFSIAVPASYSGTYGVGVAWAGERFETGPGFENGEWIYRDFTWSAPILDPITVAPAQHAQADGVPFLGTLQLGVVAALLAAVVRLNGRSKVP